MQLLHDAGEVQEPSMQVCVRTVGRSARTPKQRFGSRHMVSDCRLSTPVQTNTHPKTKDVGRRRKTKTKTRSVEARRMYVFLRILHRRWRRTLSEQSQVTQLSKPSHGSRGLWSLVSGLSGSSSSRVSGLSVVSRLSSLSEPRLSRLLSRLSRLLSRLCCRLFLCLAVC